MNDNLDPESLTTILGISLEDQDNWEHPLVQFRKLISGLRSKNPPVLDEPFTYLTDNLVFISMPNIVRKCLSLTNCNIQNYQYIINFLHEVILLIKAVIDYRQNSQLVPLLCEILDDAQGFHISRVNQNQTNELCLYVANNGIPNSLVNLFPNQSEFKIEDFVASMTLFHRLARSLGIDHVFKDKNQSITIICNTLNTFATETEDRKIPFKQVLDIISQLISFDTGEEVQNLLVSIMMYFVDNEIIDIKFSGIKLCVTLFTHIIPTSKISEPQFQSIFSYILCQTNSNIESITLLKPVLIKFAENDLLDPVLIDSFWESINNVAPSVIQRGYDLFSDISLKIKPDSKETIDYILKKVLEQPNIDILCRLIKGPQYSEVAIKELSKLAEKDGNFNAVEALVKVSSSADLSDLLPSIMEHMNNSSLLKNHILLIDSILIKKPMTIDSSLIITNLAQNISMFSSDEIEEIMKAFSDILIRTNQKIQKNDLSLLFTNYQDNDCLFKILDFIFTEKGSLTTTDSYSVVDELIDRATTSFTLFSILKHFYLNVNDQQLNEKVFQALWKIILHPINEEQRKATSELLLTFSNNSIVPSKLDEFVKLCLDDLLSSENPNSAIFINECLSFASKYVFLESFNLEPHRFTVPEDMITVSVDISGLPPDSNHLELSINNQNDVSNLIVALSAKLNREVTSMILYSKGKSVPNKTKLVETDLKFEVRFRTEYERVPPFTISNHPISLFNDDKYIHRMLSLLDSPIGEEVYNVLINIPTPKQFSESAQTMNIDPSKPYLFLYDLHYLAKHLDELPNKKDLQINFENIICDHFETIVPEARYLLVLLLDEKTKNEKLVTKVLYTLCVEKKMSYFVRIMRRLWAIVSDFEIDLPTDILSSIIFKDNQKFNELAMKSHLIQSQKFDKVWEIFTNCDDKDKLKHVKIFTMFQIPPEKYQEVFDTLYPLFDSLDESILSIFAQMSDKWPEFPADKIANTLITSYIKCTTKPQSISENPFKLILSIAEKNENMRTEIIDAFKQTIPEVLEWNYQPTDSFKCNDRCGLENLGATCYVNSGLQQIFNIESLRNFIVSKNDFIDQSMQSLHKLFSQMLFSQRKFIDMHSFASQWTGWDGACIDPREQQDVNDFLMLLFSKLEVYPDIYSLFSGETEMQFTNVNTNEIVSTQKTTFSTFPLIVLGQKTIQDSMKIANIPEIIENYKVDDNSPSIRVKSTNVINSLPPYLFVQLKRFDYSIETQTRIKIDQRYEFEFEFDFKDYVNFSGETRFKLIGVILHQGDVDVGHYISYTKVEDNKWLCLNDTSVTIVSDNIMMNNTYGNPEGSTGYILVYERYDASSLPKIEIKEDPTLIDEIQNDNLRLIVDSVYFSPYFADFVQQLILNLGFSNKEVSLTIFKYTFNSLVHSSLIHSFSKIIDAIIAKIKESEEVLMNLFEFLQEQINLVLDVMMKCTNKEIKMKFSELVLEIFKCQKEDSLYFIYISEKLDDWYPTILENWRNGFDIFKLFVDFANIDQDHLNLIRDMDIISGVISFVVNSFQPFVSNKDNKITQSRFVRLIDMTWIFKLLEAVHYPIDEIIKPSFMKWCIGSEKHSKSFLHLIQSEIPHLQQLVSKCGTRLSEPFVAELVLNSPVPFKIPKHWLKDYCYKAADRKHIFQAITDEIGTDIDLFRKFADQRELFVTILFTNEENVSDDFIIFLRKILNKIIENNQKEKKNENEMSLNEFASIMFKFVENVPEASGTLYASNNNYLNKTAPPPQYFLCVNYLTFLGELAPRIDNLEEQVQVVSQALQNIVAFKPQHDEHAVLLSIIGCTMMRDDKISTIPSQLVQSIEYTLSTMTKPEHKQLQSLLRALVIGLTIHYDKSKLSTSLIVPDEPVAKYLYRAAMSKDQKPLKKPSIELLKICGRRYATATKSLKFFFNYLAEIDNIDMAAVYEILSEYARDSIDSNYKVIENKKEALSLLITQFYAIKDKRDVLANSTKFLKYIIEHSNQIAVESIQTYKTQIQSMCRFVVDERNDNRCRAAGLSIISIWLSVAHFDIYEYSSLDQPHQAVLSHFNDVNDEDQEFIDVFTETLILNSNENEKIKKNLPTELQNSFSIAKSGDQRLNTINSFTKITVDESFANEVVHNKLLQKIWSLEYKKEGIALDGLYKVTVDTKPQWEETTGKEIAEAAALFPLHEENNKIILYISE